MPLAPNNSKWMPLAISLKGGSIITAKQRTLQYTRIGQIGQYTRMLRKILCQAHLVMIMDMTLKRISIKK
jgi:hypothetical protein